MNDPAYPSLANLARDYASGELTPETVVNAHLERIAEHDDKLGAFQVVYADEARRAAAATTELLRTGHRIGPFQGIPFALKDIVDLEGHITTGGSYTMRERVSPTTATLARNLIAAGGILLGKTKTVEVAMGGWGTNQRMGTPWNPWDLRTHRAPGGSSSGSGVAVASGMAACAVGTDTGGSVRIPAAWNGIVGLKVTEGTVSTHGVLPLSHTLDTPGPIARSVEDALLMLDAMTGRHATEAERCWHERTGWFEGYDRGVAGMRIGCMDDALRAHADPDVLAAYDAALEELRGLGAHVEPFSLPHTFEALRDRVGQIISAEGNYHHGELMADPDAEVDSDVPPRILPGREIDSRAYIALLLRRESDIAEVLEQMRGIDVWLTPTLGTVAPPIDSIDQSTSPAGFTRIVNYLRMCALTVPCGLGEEGLPVGLQIVARARDEALSCRVGAAYERATKGIGNPRI